jgi:hypothetical protein
MLNSMLYIILRAEREQKDRGIRMKVSKFQFAMLILIVATICAMSIVYIDILRTKAALDRLYRIAENQNPRGGFFWESMQACESRLHQELAVISCLAVIVAFLSLFTYRSFRKSKMRTKALEKYAAVALILTKPKIEIPIILA